MRKFDKDGHTIPDPPLALPVGFSRPLPLAERVAQLTRSALLASLADNNDIDNFDDADDFNIPDDPVDITTPWEDRFDPVNPGGMTRAREIAHGAVADRTFAEKETARERLRSYRDRRSGKGNGDARGEASEAKRPKGSSAERPESSGGLDE